MLGVSADMVAYISQDNHKFCHFQVHCMAAATSEFKRGRDAYDNRGGKKSVLENSHLAVYLDGENGILDKRPVTEYGGTVMKSNELLCLAIVELMFKEFGYFDLLGRFKSFRSTDVIISLLVASRPLTCEFYDEEGCAVVAKTLRALIGEDDDWLHTEKSDQRTQNSYVTPRQMRKVADIIEEVKKDSFNDWHVHAIVRSFMLEFMFVHNEVFNLGAGMDNTDSLKRTMLHYTDPMYPAVSLIMSLVGFSDEIADMIRKVPKDAWSLVHRAVEGYDDGSWQTFEEPNGGKRTVFHAIRELPDEKYVVFVRRFMDGISRLSKDPTYETYLQLEREKVFKMNAVM